MKKITYNHLRYILNRINNKRLLVEVKGIIIQNLKIQKSKIYISKNILTIEDDGIEKIGINTSWIANYYANENNNIELEFDQLGEVNIKVI